MNFESEGKELLLRSIPLLLIPCYALALAISFVSLPVLPQDPGYHHFADSRAWMGVPNAADVLSNLAILLPALWGLRLTLDGGASGDRFRHAGERMLAGLFFSALVLTAAGSTWYHLAPNDTRLFWDRLPLGLAFTTLIALLIAERTPVGRVDMLMLFLWALAGPLAVIWWHAGPTGDLRPYFLLHGFMFLCPPLLAGMASPYPQARSHLLWAWLLFILAMAGDRFDHAMHDLTGHLVSGHTLKHLFMGLAIAVLAHMLAIRGKEAHFARDGNNRMGVTKLR